MGDKEMETSRGVEGMTLATAPTLERLVKIINEYYVSTSYEARATEVATRWNVISAAGIRTNVWIDLARGRYKFMKATN